MVHAGSEYYKDNHLGGACRGFIITLSAMGLPINVSSYHCAFNTGGQHACRQHRIPVHRLHPQVMPRLGPADGLRATTWGRVSESFILDMQEAACTPMDKGIVPVRYEYGSDFAISRSSRRRGNHRGAKGLIIRLDGRCLWDASLGIPLYGVSAGCGR